MTGKPFYRTITEEILDYVVREMTDPQGGFYSTQDADSEGEEGKFFTWTPDEIRSVLGDDAQADIFIEAYGVTIGGNLEGKNILEFVGDLERRQALAEARRKLFKAREERVHPNRDDKVLTSWNGLISMAVTSLLKLAGFTNDPRYVDVAHQVLTQVQPMMAQHPLGFGQWLQALSYALARPKEIAIVGELNAADTQALLGVVRSGYQPFQVVALGAPSAQPPAVPLLQDRGLLDGQAAAYVCHDFTCQAPVTEPEGLRAQLERR